MPKLEDIEGIGKKNATTLRKAGIGSTNSLLQAGKTPASRKKLVAETGISNKLILGWVNRADLMRVKGVGEEYSDLLERSGVDTCKELKTRKPVNLHEKMHEVNKKKKLVRRPPSLGEVERWVADAKKLKAVVKY